MDKNLAIVGIFYDGYYDIWEDFLELFERNWPDCPYPLYIVDAEKKLSYAKEYRVTVLNAGCNAEYSKKVQMAIKDIDTDYLLLLLEDFFIYKPVDTKEFIKLFDLVKKKGIDYYCIPSTEFSGGAKQERESEAGHPYMRKFNDKDDYTVSCQPAIWNKEFLKECIGRENYNAWIFEGVYAHAKESHTPEFLSKLRIDYRNPLNIRHGAVQGKILPEVYKDITDTGYVFRNKREILDYKSDKLHKIKQKLIGVLPENIKKLIKLTLPNVSVSEKYKEQTLEVMKKMNLTWGR